MADKLYISQLNVGGEAYDIKDTEARDLIAGIQKGGVQYIGRTTTALTDGATTNPITIVDGDSTKEVTVVEGNLTIYNAGTGDEHKDLEFIWNGAHWDELGSTGALGDLAYADSATGTLNWSHTHSFTESDATVEVAGTTAGVGVNAHSYTPAGTISKGTGTANYTPEGTISFTTMPKDAAISGSTADATVGAHTYTPAGTVAVTAAAATTGETNNYTPAGTISQPTFTGTEATIAHTAHSHNATLSSSKATSLSHSVTQGTVTGSVGVTVGDHTYTPEGTVSKPTFTGTTATITPTYGTTDVVNATVIGETLEIKNVSAVTKVSGVSYTPAGTISQPTFTGTEATIAHTASGTFSNGKTAGVAVAAHNVSIPDGVTIEETVVAAHKFTPAGSVSKPTFTGTGTLIKAAFTGTQATLSHAAHKHASGTLAGSVDVPTVANFTGTGVNLVFTGTKATLSHTVTQGTVSASGTYKRLASIQSTGKTAETITVTPVK